MRRIVIGILLALLLAVPLTTWLSHETRPPPIIQIRVPMGQPTPVSVEPMDVRTI